MSCPFCCAQYPFDAESGFPPSARANGRHRSAAHDPAGTQMVTDAGCTWIRASSSISPPLRCRSLADHWETGRGNDRCARLGIQPDKGLAAPY
jgi:hypothetical protein